MMGRLAPLWLAALILTGGVYAQLKEPTFIETLRNLAFDTFQRSQPRIYRPSPVRILDIDDESLQRLGQWPWSRNVLANIVNRLRQAGARSVAFDIVFAEPDRTSPARAIEALTNVPLLRQLASNLPDYDRVFAEAVAPGGVVMGFALLSEPSQGRSPAQKAGFAAAGDDPALFIPAYQGAVTSLPALEAAAEGNGALNFVPGLDGIVRRVPLLVRQGDTFYPTLVTEALRVAERARTIQIKSSGASGEFRFGKRTGLVALRIGNVAVPTDPFGGLWMHYTRPVAERYIPVWKLLEGQVPPARLAGAIVLVGTSAAGLQDLRFSPLSGAMPGVEIHAQAVEQILHGDYLSRPDWAAGAEIGFMVGLGLLLAALIFRSGALWSAFIGILAVAGAGTGSWHAFTEYRLLIDPLSPSLAAAAIYVASSVVRHRQTERERGWIRDAFSSYVSPNLVDHLVDSPGALKLGGERRDCSFVFTDLAGFTPLMEGREPEEVVDILNDYIEGMIQITFRHEGLLDRIVGDAVAVIFSAPVEQPDHARRAVACAAEMNEFGTAFSEAKNAEGVPLGSTRIGVNTGLVVLGNFGGESIFDYRALGDPINTAARLEQVNKRLGTTVCVSASTVEQCPDFTGRPVGQLILKGKVEPVPCFEPVDPKAMEKPVIQAYLHIIRLDRTGSIRKALTAIHESSAQGLSRRFPDVVRIEVVSEARSEHGIIVNIRRTVQESTRDRWDGWLRTSIRATVAIRPRASAPTQRNKRS